MKSKAMFAAGSVMLAVGIFAAGMATGGAAEAANPATVTIRYISEGSCGTVSGTKNAAVVSSSTAMSGLRGCTAVFRVVR